MRVRPKKSGFSLTELLVAMSIIGILAGIGLPAVKQVVKAFESSDRVRDAVGAAMSNARARALARGKYTGVRFQRNADGDQYMVFIEHDDTGSAPADGFRPVIGRNPIRLPRSGLVMDMNIRTDILNASNPAYLPLTTDAQIDTPQEIVDASTLCIIFSPAGKLVMHDVRIWEGAGDVFNIDTEVDLGNAILYIDSYPADGLGEEVSRNHFVIVDKSKLNAAPVAERYTSYFQHLKPVYVNPYTGELID
jgi:prepilin-type N-terminal cleavage/methylation domain-containing protein